HDAMLEIDLLDRSLDQVVHEGWVADRRAALAPVLVGNRAALTASYLTDLAYSQRTRTSEGFWTGLRRPLESHTAHGLPLTIHLNGALTDSIGWSASANPLQDGPTFLARVAEFFDGDTANGEGGFVPGLYTDSMLPYFENQGAADGPNARFMARAAETYANWLNVTAPGQVFWTPERVIDGSSFADLTQAGFTHTAIDRTHLATWFGAAVTDGALHRVNGVDCFVIDPTARLFGQTDGGADIKLRKLLIERALDPNAQQAVVFVADWEEYAGHKGNSDVPDVYDRVLHWIAQRPWIEVASLNDLAGRGWTAIDHGVDPTLPVEAHEWLRHANEESYDHWYYGHSLEESFSALRPEIFAGRPHARALGDVHSAGTLLGDLWADIQSAPAGELRNLAELGYAGALYRTAWHTEDQHNLTRLANGAYLQPDSTYDLLSGFSFALGTHIGRAAIVSYAARWAENPANAPGVSQIDVDMDGELEYVLQDDQILLVFEQDGGRLVAGFVRDLSTRQGYQVLGNALCFPERSREIGWEDPAHDAPQNSLLKDTWVTGQGHGYANDATVAAVSTTSVALTFTTADGVVEKQIEWTGPGTVEVTYTLDPNAGTLYMRGGLNPDLAALVATGQQNLVATDQGGVYTLENQGAQRTVFVSLGYADAGHTARHNTQATDTTTASPRNNAYQHMIELSGDAPGFSFSISAGIR
ncbi:hypothetical protein OAX78_02565, partial [Planctomycetota bacterium]|nr:hypothetical protein [Planctomycetota bacterium]